MLQPRLRTLTTYFNPTIKTAIPWPPPPIAVNMLIIPYQKPLDTHCCGHHEVEAVLVVDFKVGQLNFVLSVRRQVSNWREEGKMTVSSDESVFIVFGTTNSDQDKSWRIY